MRKLFLLLAISVSAFAASAQNSAKVSASALKESRANGIYVFQLSDNVGEKEVVAASNYYTQYFATAYNPSKHEMKLTLTENAEMNRRVIQRLMVALNVSEVFVDAKSQPFEEVYNAYMK